MKNHTKIYITYFNYSSGEYMPCEICEAPAVDVHHIEARGMGGDPNGNKDEINNLMGLCRKCHIENGDVPDLIEVLKQIHFKFMAIYGRK